MDCRRERKGFVSQNKVEGNIHSEVVLHVLGPFEKMKVFLRANRRWVLSDVNATKNAGGQLLRNPIRASRDLANRAPGPTLMSVSALLAGVSMHVISSWA